MTFPARLRVIYGTEPVGEGFDFLERVLVRLVGRLVHHSVGKVVESGWSFRGLRSVKGQCQNGRRQKGHNKQNFHRACP